MTKSPKTRPSKKKLSPRKPAVPGSVLGEGVTPLDVSMVLAKVFRVQYAEVALLRWMAACSSSFPRASAHHGSDSNLQQAVAARILLSARKPRSQQFRSRKTRQHLRNHQTDRSRSRGCGSAPPIQKLMSVPILDPNSTVLGVLQISRKVWTRASRRLQPRRPSRSGTCRWPAGGFARDVGKLNF